MSYIPILNPYWNKKHLQFYIFYDYVHETKKQAQKGEERKEL